MHSTRLHHTCVYMQSTQPHIHRNSIRQYIPPINFPIDHTISPPSHPHTSYTVKSATVWTERLLHACKGLCLIWTHNMPRAHEHTTFRLSVGGCSCAQTPTVPTTRSMVSWCGMLAMPYRTPLPLPLLQRSFQLTRPGIRG